MNKEDLRLIKKFIQEKIDVYVEKTEIDFKIRYLMIQELEDLLDTVTMYYKLNLEVKKRT
jgi:hypothetical protein